MQSAHNTELRVSVNISPMYQNHFVTMERLALDLVLSLQEGPQVITTEPVQIGTLNGFGNPAILASFSIWYEFNSAQQTLVLCSNEFVSEKSPFITTQLQGTTQTCIHHAHPGVNVTGRTNITWNPNTPLTPGLPQELQATVQAINTAVLQQARNLGLTVIELGTPPLLPAEVYKSFCPVYHQGKFYEFYDESKSYGPDYTIGTFDSIYGGLTHLTGLEAFANVIGSTCDPKVPNYSSWISLWIGKVGPTSVCTSYNTAGIPGSQVGAFTCTPAKPGKSEPLFGGHVILGENSETTPKSVNYVLILPICPNHNSNDSVYMQAITYTTAVALHNYFGH